MTSITDEQKFIDTNFNTIQQFERSSFDELASIVISTLAGILLNFDQSGAKFALPESEWNSQPENITAGPRETIRPRPSPPLPGIPAGEPPVLIKPTLYKVRSNYAICCIGSPKPSTYN